MDAINPKVSFIPKNSLIREESFLERPRPKSVLGLIALFSFLVSTFSYGGLFYYHASLVKKIETRLAEVSAIQGEFSRSPEIKNAKAFQSRVSLAQEILDNHFLVSRVLGFLSDNTLESVMYEKLSFTQDEKGMIAEISGEAPNYSALAYQSDLLKSKSKELSNFSTHSVSLTKLGTVTFTTTMVFNPAYLSYVKTVREVPSLILSDSPASSVATSSLISTTSLKYATTTSSFPVASTTKDFATSSRTVAPAISTTTSPSSATSPSLPVVNVAKPSVPKSSTLGSFWSRLKFW